MSFSSNSRTYGQNETLISSIRNILKDYSHESIFKEFLQNADDAGATRFRVIIDSRSHPTNSLLSDKMEAWQGPAILIFNNAQFKEQDFDSLMQIRVGGKHRDYTKIGKHGLGFNSCYHFTDAPSFISGDSIAFLDPQEKYLPRKNDLPQRGMIGPFPKNGIRRFRERDQLAPFEDIEGISFHSTFEGVLFRIPLRQQPSEISDRIFPVDDVLKLFKSIKSNITSHFLFLRNVEEIEVSHIPEAASPFQARSLWKATVKNLDKDVRKKRKEIVDGEIQVFQMKIELIDEEKNEQNDQWIIATGAQQDPEDSELREYARRHRLRILGGVASLLKSQKNEDEVNKAMVNEYQRGFMGRMTFKSQKEWEEIENQNDFKGRMFSFLPLPDDTCLPVHLNGTWAQSSDRARLLLEKDNLADLDHQKLGWNRHILLEFLPKVYCKLLEEILKLHNNNEIDLENRCISNFWPFPPVTQNYPKYIISFGCKVLQHILQSENIFQLITSDYYYLHNGDVTFTNENVKVDNLFRCLSYSNITAFRELLRKNWKEIGVKKDHNLKSIIRSLPIWPMRWNPSMPRHNLSLVPVSNGYLLPKNFNMYRTKSTKTFLRVSDDLDAKILDDLDVPMRSIDSYASEDIEHPEESDHNYEEFMDSLLSYGNYLTKDLMEKNRFPNAFTNELKRIADLYDYDNIVFRTVFGGDSNNFLHLSLAKHATKLSHIGFNNEINQESFTKCAVKVEELQEMVNPPSDIRYRGFILVDHFYKNIGSFEFNGIDRIPFVPIVKCLEKHYNNYYNYTQVLDCFKNVILPEYKEVAWSQKPLIAEDVIPPCQVLQRYPSFGKPNVATVIKHLRFLRKTLIEDSEWMNWKETFVFNVFKVYEWLDEKCLNEGLSVKEYINSNELLFLNFNKNQDPFDTENWVSATSLVLNTEPNERKYVNPRLAKYHTMLKSAGVREIKSPSFKIKVREYDQSNINKAMLGFLSRKDNLLHDVVFIVNGEEIRASQYMLAASSNFFYRKFNSLEYVGSSTVNPATITIDNVSPSSVHVLLRYLYGQNIDVAIWNNQSLNGNKLSNSENLELHKNILELANDYELDHLKDLMELKLSHLVNKSNMLEMEDLARDLNANQLEKYCCCYIHENENL
ncbi:4457_t:CDS:2 [Entrophospora sp. SA101]|nr:15639_t:CDS:2 [Entrophospora sp. SA101]CAJ0840687.1 4457_t:CDS:2 [Entrophospora sp. SA101]